MISKEIVAGFRTPAGRITTTQSFKTIQIPRLVRGKPDAWDPQICLAWGNQFLTWLRESIRDAEPGIEPSVWRVKLTPHSGVTLTRLNSTDVRDVEGGEDRAGFLPRWYWDEVWNQIGTGEGTGSVMTAERAHVAEFVKPRVS